MKRVFWILTAVLLLLSGCMAPAQGGNPMQYRVIAGDVNDLAPLVEALGIDEEKVIENSFSTVYILGDSPLPNNSVGDEIIIDHVVEGEACRLDYIVGRDSLNNLTDKTVRSSSGTGQKTNHFWDTGDIAVDADLLSVALGFRVDEEVCVSDPLWVEVEAGGQVFTITVPVCVKYTFDIYRRDPLGRRKLVGAGSAYRVLGFQTIAYAL